MNTHVAIVTNILNEQLLYGTYKLIIFFEEIKDE